MLNYFVENDLLKVLLDCNKILQRNYFSNNLCFYGEQIMGFIEIFDENYDEVKMVLVVEVYFLPGNQRQKGIEEIKEIDSHELEDN